MVAEMVPFGVAVVSRNEFKIELANNVIVNHFLSPLRSASSILGKSWPDLFYGERIVRDDINALWQTSAIWKTLFGGFETATSEELAVNGRFYVVDATVIVRQPEKKRLALVTLIDASEAIPANIVEKKLLALPKPFFTLGIQRYYRYTPSV